MTEIIENEETLTPKKTIHLMIKMAGFMPYPHEPANGDVIEAELFIDMKPGITTNADVMKQVRKMYMDLIDACRTHQPKQHRILMPQQPEIIS